MRPLLLLPVITAVLLVACAPVQARPASSSSAGSCIPPRHPFAFSVRPDTNPEADAQVLPPAPWTVEAPLPPLPNGARSWTRLWVVQVTNGADEIWATRQWWAPPEYASNEQLLRYEQRTGKWQEYPEQVSDAVRPGELFLDNRNVLWSYNYRADPSYPLFSRYDAQSGLFRLVKESAGIANGLYTVDPNNVIWIVPAEGPLVSFDATVPVVRTVLGLPGEQVLSVASAPDGTLYILKGTSNITSMSDELVLHYLPVEDRYERVWPTVRPYPPINNLLVDPSGRLWLDDRGWQEPNGTWYETVRSPIFITDPVDWSPMSSRWEAPRLLLESSDHRLWYQSGNGLAWLDPQAGQWCWFTTYRSNAVEDARHTVWIVAGDKLYRLALSAK